MQYFLLSDSVSSSRGDIVYNVSYLQRCVSDIGVTASIYVGCYPVSLMIVVSRECAGTRGVYEREREREREIEREREGGERGGSAATGCLRLVGCHRVYTKKSP